MQNTVSAADLRAHGSPSMMLLDPGDKVAGVTAHAHRMLACLSYTAIYRTSM